MNFPVSFLKQHVKLHGHEKREINSVIAFDAAKQKLHIFGVLQFILRFFFSSSFCSVLCSTFSFPYMIMKSCDHQPKNNNFCGYSFRIMGFLKNRMSLGGAPLTLLCTDRSHFCSVSLSYRIHIFKCTLLHFSSYFWCIFFFLVFVWGINSGWMVTSRLMLATFAFSHLLWFHEFFPSRSVISIFFVHTKECPR